MGWRVRGSSLGTGEFCRARPDWLWGPLSLLYSGYQITFPGAKRPGGGVDNPHLPLRLKKE